MRTTVDILGPLLREAQMVLGTNSMTETVVLSLQEVVRRKRIDELKTMMGNINLEIDLPSRAADHSRNRA